MISVSVPILDIHIILLDPMLILSGMVIIFLQGISLKVSEPAEAPEMPSAFTQGFVIVPVHCALITLQLFIEFYIFAFAISMSKKSYELFSRSPQLSTHSMNLCHTLVLMTSLTSEVHSLLLLDSQVFSLHVYMVSQKSLFCPYSVSQTICLHWQDLSMFSPGSLVTHWLYYTHQSLSSVLQLSLESQ